MAVLSALPFLKLCLFVCLPVPVVWVGTHLASGRLHAHEGHRLRDSPQGEETTKKQGREWDCRDASHPSLSPSLLHLKADTS